MATWGRAPLYLALVLSVAACSSNDTKASAPTAPPSTRAPTTPPAPDPTTTTTVPLYSFDNSVPPPKLINTGTDYKKIVKSLLDYSSWMVGHHPTRDAVDTIAAPGSRGR